MRWKVDVLKLFSVAVAMSFMVTLQVKGMHKCWDFVLILSSLFPPWQDNQCGLH